jgi:hypothetical protein
MKCPNCERRIDIFRLRCRVCHERLPFWYIFVIVLLLAVAGGLILLLELF